jgi:hypothetical protein
LNEELTDDLKREPGGEDFLSRECVVTGANIVLKFGKFLIFAEFCIERRVGLLFVEEDERLRPN